MGTRSGREVPKPFSHTERNDQTTINPGFLFHPERLCDRHCCFFPEGDGDALPVLRFNHQGPPLLERHQSRLRALRFFYQTRARICYRHFTGISSLTVECRQGSRFHQHVGRDITCIRISDQHVRAGHALGMEPEIVGAGNLHRKMIVACRALSHQDLPAVEQDFSYRR